jgi:hypothetical protein
MRDIDYQTRTPGPVSEGNVRPPRHAPTIFEDDDGKLYYTWGTVTASTSPAKPYIP